jgi:hypothetical protein
MARDYKDEYEKFQKDKSTYRAKLNKYNRDKGTYGNGDGKDASHKNGEITGFEDSSSNKGKKEKSRLKGSKRKFKMGGYNEYPNGGMLNGASHENGGIPIEAEGGEIIINSTMNNAAGQHEEDLLALNQSPEDYEIIHKNELAANGGLIEKNAINRGTIDTLEYINRHGDLPLSDARNRSKK